MYEFDTRKMTVAQEPYDGVAGPVTLGRAAQSPLKRAMDVFGALGLAIFLAPLLLVVAAVVRLNSPGPIIFTQLRSGLGGREFRIYKFRTMTVIEDDEAVRQATRNDARVTRVGSFLRRSSFDELPQLINVLRGDMSLVGPRPHALAHDQQFGAAVSDYHLRFRVRPGITGLAQVTGHRGEIVSLEQLIGRVSNDNSYIDNWSLWADVEILFRTVLTVPFHRSAY